MLCETHKMRQSVNYQIHLKQQVLSLIIMIIVKKKKKKISIFEQKMLIYIYSFS